MKVLFINDSTTNPNWGDRAATISLLEMVRAAGGTILHSITERDIYLTSFSVPSKHRAADSGGGQLPLGKFAPPVLHSLVRRAKWRGSVSSRGGLIPRRVTEFDAFTRTVLGRRNPWPQLLGVMLDSDLVIINGDGGMVGNGIWPRTVMFLAHLAKERFDKAVVIVNHTADFDHPDLHAMAQRVYPSLDDVVFRDRISVERCATICGSRFAADSAYSFEPIDRAAWLPVARRATFFDVWPDTAAFDPAAGYLCIGGSSIFGVRGQIDSIRRQYALLIEHLRMQYEGQVVLTASCLGDEAVFRDLSLALGVPLIGAMTPVQQAVDVLGNAEAYIGGRWHPSIFALRGGVPVIPLSSKTFKMQALADEAGLSSTTFDAFTIGSDRVAVARCLHTLLEQGHDLRVRLRSWAEGQSLSAWGNVDYLGTSGTRTA